MTESVETQSTSRRPTFAAFTVRDRKDGEQIWIRIGSAWKHADEEGFNVQIDAMPFDGRIVLRVASDKDR